MTCWDGRVRLLEMARCADQRGSLVEYDFSELPFDPRRGFVVHGVPEAVARGGHAHKRGQQLLICLAGTITVELRYNDEVRSVVLSTPSQAFAR